MTNFALAFRVGGVAQVHKVAARTQFAGVIIGMVSIAAIEALGAALHPFIETWAAIAVVDTVIYLLLMQRAAKKLAAIH